MVFNANARITQYFYQNNTSTETPGSIAVHDYGSEHETDLSDPDSVLDSASEPDELQSEGQPGTPTTSPDTSDDENTESRPVGQDTTAETVVGTETGDVRLKLEALKGELEDVSVERWVWKGRYDEMKGGFESLEKKLEDEKKQKEEVSATATTCQQELDESRDDIRRLEDKLAQARRSNISLESDLAAASERIDELEEKFHEGQRPVFVVGILQGKLDAAERESAQLQKENTRLEVERSRERQEKETLHRRIETLGSQIEEQQQQHDLLRQQLYCHQQENTSLRQQVKTLSSQHSALADPHHALEIGVNMLEIWPTALTFDVQDPHIPLPPLEGNQPGPREDDSNVALASQTDPLPPDIPIAGRLGLLPMAGYTVTPYQDLSHGDNQISPTHPERDSVQPLLAQEDGVATPSHSKPSAMSVPLDIPIEAYPGTFPRRDHTVTFYQAYNHVDEQVTQGPLEREPRPTEENGDDTPTYPEPSAPSFPSDIFIEASPGVLVQQGRAVTSYEVPDLAEDHVPQSPLGGGVMQPSPVEDSRDSMPSYPEPSAALLLLAIAMGAYRGAFVHADRHVASYYDFDHTHSQVSQSHQERGAIQPPPVEVDGNGTPPCPEPSGPDDTISTDSSYEPHVEPLTPATEVTIAEQENVRAQDVALDIGVAGVPDGPPATTSPPPLGTPPSVLIPPEPSTSDGTGPIDYPVEPCVEPLTPRTEVTSMDEEAIGVRNVTQEEAVGVSVGPQPTRSPPPQDRPLSVLEPSVRSTPPPSLRPPKSVRHGVKKDRRDRSRRDRAKNPAFVRKGDNLSIQAGWTTDSRGRRRPLLLDPGDSGLPPELLKLIRLFELGWRFKKYAWSLIERLSKKPRKT